MATFDISPLLGHLTRVATSHCVIAIDGVGCAGKTTLAAQMAEALGARIVHFDDFYRVLDPATRESLNPRDGYQNYFDWERLRNDLLIPLKMGQTGCFRKYDWSKNALGKIIENVEPTGYLIIEGVYSCRPELRTFYNHTIFVKVPREIRELRAIARDENSPFWISRWMAAEDFYITSASPESSAEWVFDGVTGEMITMCDGAHRKVTKDLRSEEEKA